jgi:hypothetical protein
MGRRGVFSGREDVYRAALRQLCRVEDRNIDDPLESDFAIVMRALEEALTEEAGRTKRLNRTRQKLSRGFMAAPSCEDRWLFSEVKATCQSASPYLGSQPTRN